MMKPSAFFAMLGAPFRNVRWSWGAVREADGAVFLRVWEDRKRPHDSATFVKATHRWAYRENGSNPGFREREEHVRRIRRGAPCYLVFCKAVDMNARPRKIESFNTSEVFPGGRMAELDGEVWIEVLAGVPVRKVMLSVGSRE